MKTNIQIRSTPNRQKGSPIHKEDGKWAKHVIEEDLLFTGNLETTFQSNDESEKEIKAFLNTPYHVQWPLENFTIEQVTNFITNKTNLLAKT